MRRLIGLFFAVLWFTTALQTCLMASIPEAMPEAATHSGVTRHAHADPASTGCAHCVPSRDRSEPCADPATADCAGADRTPYLTQTKPPDAEKLHRLPKPPGFAQCRAPVAHKSALASARPSDPPSRAAGPALIDLFRCYLK